MLALSVACTAAAAVWAYLLIGHGGYWRTSQRLPPCPAPSRPAGEPARWPGVVAVIPARNEAAMLPAVLPTLLGQDYPGALTVILVDDCSSDGTAEVAAGLGPEPGRPGRALRVVAGARCRPAGPARCGPWPRASPRPARARPRDPSGTGPGTCCSPTPTSPGRPGRCGPWCARPRTTTGTWSPRWRCCGRRPGGSGSIVPAFVYFFAQLYPFPRVNSPRSRTAAAAGGCMLVRREALERSGGLAPISGARIDDVALGQLIKRQRGRCWLGLSTAVVSVRPVPQAGRPVADGGQVGLHPAPVFPLAAGRDRGRAGVHLRPAARRGDHRARGRGGDRAGGARRRRGPGRLGPDVAVLPAHAPAVPAVAAAGSRPAADRPAVRRDDR